MGSMSITNEDISVHERVGEQVSGGERYGVQVYVNVIRHKAASSNPMGSGFLYSRSKMSRIMRIGTHVGVASRSNFIIFLSWRGTPSMVNL